LWCTQRCCQKKQYLSKPFTIDLEPPFIFCCGYIPIVFVNASSRRIKCMRERDYSVTSIPTIECEPSFLNTKHIDPSCISIIRFLPLLTPSSYPSYPSLLPRFATCLTPLFASFTEFQTQLTIHRDSSSIFLLLVWGCCWKFAAHHMHIFSCALGWNATTCYAPSFEDCLTTISFISKHRRRPCLPSATRSNTHQPTPKRKHLR